MPDPGHLPGSYPLCADWDRTIAALQKELAIARARMEASASHERARELEFGALAEQLENARTAVDHLQAQNFRILEQLEQASAPARLQWTWVQDLGFWVQGCMGTATNWPACAAVPGLGCPQGVGQQSLVMQLETGVLLPCLHAGWLLWPLAAA